MIGSAALALTLAAASPSGGRIEDLGYVQGAAAFPVSCDVTVVFGSYATGPDSEVLGKARSYANHSKYVRRAMMVRHGREGERTICLVVAPRARTAQVYADIRKMIPAYSRRSTTSVSSRDGKHFQTQWPK